jgi:hypothetical protein
MVEEEGRYLSVAVMTYTPEVEESKLPDTGPL